MHAITWVLILLWQVKVYCSPQLLDMTGEGTASCAAPSWRFFPCACEQGSTTTCVPGGTTASSTKSGGRTAPRAATGSVCRREWTSKVPYVQILLLRLSLRQHKVMLLMKQLPEQRFNRLQVSTRFVAYVRSSVKSRRFLRCRFSSPLALSCSRSGCSAGVSHTRRAGLFFIPVSTYISLPSHWLWDSRTPGDHL